MTSERDPSASPETGRPGRASGGTESANPSPARRDFSGAIRARRRFSGRLGQVAPFAGPVLIVVTSLIVLRGFWLQGHLTNQQVDVLAFWLPRWCYLGQALQAGHIPTWLPNQFGGVPFASDPQSGWLYVPVMLLFSLFSCGRALALFITLQPILAGLGLYWFFRHEGLGRPAATIGGLTLSLTISGSAISLSIPFSGMLAWTALTLAGASGYLRARSRLSLFGWLAFTGFCWSQIAAAHLTDGLLIGSMVLGLYVVFRTFAQVRAGQRSAWNGVAVAGGLLVALPVLAAAALIPRLALLPRTSIGHGYQTLARLTNQLTGRRSQPPLAVRGVGPYWGTSFVRGPGGYVGALAILLFPVALFSRKWRTPALAFAVAGLIGFVLNLDVLIASPAVRKFALAHGGELWLRDPYRFRYLPVLAFAALAAYGFQAWLDLPTASDRRAMARRMAAFLPVAVVFVIMPLVAGSPLGQYVPFGFGAAYAVPLLALAARGNRWPVYALPVLLAVELTVTAVAGQFGVVPKAARLAARERAVSGFSHSFPKLFEPKIKPADYLTPGPIGQVLMAHRGDFGRYLSLNPSIAKNSSRGFLSHQGPETWPAYENGRSILFGIQEIQGYSPVQLDRYWRLVRKADTVPIYYNSATFQSLQPSVLRLFGVEWLVVPTSLPLHVSGLTRATAEHGYTLYRLARPEPRASVVFNVRAATPGAALVTVLRLSFDPATDAITDPDVRLAVCGAPCKAPNRHPPTTAYAEGTPEHAVIRVNSPGAGLLVVRNVYDKNWHATVDGHAAPLVQADYLMQGVPVPAGTHTVTLVYRDRAIGLGLVVSGAAWALLLAAIGALWILAAPSRQEGSAGAG